YRRMPGLLRTGIESTLEALPGFRGTAMKGRLRLARKMARSPSLAPRESFIRNCTSLDAGQKTNLYTPAVQDQIGAYDPAVQHHARFDKVCDAGFLNQMLYLATKIFMTI